MPRYEREGKSYLTIAIGCTGGRHRSVAIADEVARLLALHSGSRIAVLHRDAHRGGIAPVDSASKPMTGQAEVHDDHSSALELKGATSPPPAASGPEERA